MNLAWRDLVPLIARFGVQWAFDFWRIVSQHPEPSPEAWAKVSAIVNKSEEDYIAEARRRLAAATGPGVPPPLPPQPDSAA